MVKARDSLGKSTLVARRDSQATLVFHGLQYHGHSLPPSLPPDTHTSTQSCLHTHLFEPLPSNKCNHGCGNMLHNDGCGIGDGVNVAVAHTHKAHGERHIGLLPLHVWVKGQVNWDLGHQQPSQAGESTG